MGNRVTIVVTEKSRRVDAAGALLGEEAWAAKTKDGRWTMRREETPGTPWVLIRQDGRLAGTYYSLPAIRRAIVAGGADFEAGRCLACQGAGRVFELRVGVEHAAGHYGTTVTDGVVSYRHDAGPCLECSGSGRAHEHATDNQGFCHICGVCMNPDWHGGNACPACDGERRAASHAAALLSL